MNRPAPAVSESVEASGGRPQVSDQSGASATNTSNPSRFRQKRIYLVNEYFVFPSHD